MADIKSELRLAKEAIKKKEHKEALKHCRVSYYFQFISIVNLSLIGNVHCSTVV